jgi:hypothetical protein
MQIKKASIFIEAFWFKGWKTGLEPATFGTTIQRSNLLSYIHRFADAKIKNFRIKKLGRKKIAKTMIQQPICKY